MSLSTEYVLTQYFHLCHLFCFLSELVLRCTHVQSGILPLHGAQHSSALHATRLGDHLHQQTVMKQKTVKNGTDVSLTWMFVHRRNLYYFIRIRIRGRIQT
jgi:hypothetical protein